MDAKEAGDSGRREPGSGGEPGLHQPHDKLFAATFEVPENAAALLRAEMPAALSSAIDWDSLKHESGSFVDPGFRRAHSDLLFSAKVLGRETLVYVLFEHQSSRDPRLVLRLLHYMVCIWMRFESLHPWPRKLPSILPVVLSQNAEVWDVPERLADLLDIPEALGEPMRPYVPDFSFRHLQLARMDYERIPGTRSGVFVLRAMKAERLGELLGDAVWEEELLAEVPSRLLEMVLRYILDGEIDRGAFEARLRGIENPRIRSQAMTLAQVYRQEGRQEGLQKGLRKGRQEDIIEALELRFGAVDEVLAEEIRSIEDDTKLRRLHRSAIQCVSLEEFAAVL